MTIVTKHNRSFMHILFRITIPKPISSMHRPWNEMVSSQFFLSFAEFAVHYRSPSSRVISVFKIVVKADVSYPFYCIWVASVISICKLPEKASFTARVISNYRLLLKHYIQYYSALCHILLIIRPFPLRGGVSYPIYMPYRLYKGCLLAVLCWR